MQQLLAELRAYLRSHRGLRRGLIGLALAALLVTVVLVALPLAVAAYGEGWLRDNGAADARIDDVDINPFAGVVRVTGLAAGTAAGARLQVDRAEVNLRWWPLTSRRAFVELLRLEGVRADVVADDDGRWHVGALTFAPARQEQAGDLEVEAESPAGPAWGFGSELVNLRDVQVTYRDGVFDTRIDVRELRVGSQYSWEAGRSTDLVLDLRVNGSPLVLRSDVAPWAAEPSLSGRLTLSDLSLEDFRRELEALAGLRDARGRIGMDLDVSGRYDADGVLRLEVAGPFNLNDAGFTLPDLRLSHRALRWDGTIALALPAQAEEPLVRLDGALQLTGFAAALADLDARLGDLRWQGDVALSPPTVADGPLGIGARAALRIRDVELRHTDLDVLLAALGEARVETLELSGATAASVGTLTLRDLRLLGAAAAAADDPAPDLLSVAELQARDVAVDAARLRVARLDVAEPELRLVRDAAGGIERLSAVLAAFDGEPAGADEPAGSDERGVEAPAGTVDDADAAVEPAPALALELDRLEVKGSRWLDVVDRSVEPPADFQLADLALTVENVSTTSGEPLRLDLATGDGVTRLTVAGTLGLFAEPLAADLDVRLEALELPPLSPYVPGYDIFRGRLSSDTRVELAGDELDVRNDLLIERLQLAGKAGADDLVSQGMTMPVDVALDLLRDREDRIRFELPVTGSLSNPSFGTGDIVRLAMQKALQNAAMSYVKNALQPLGTLMMVGNLAAKAARPRFVPVEFAAGAAELPAAGRDYLDKLSTMLAERPGLSLTLCGVATAADREALLAEALARRAEQAAAQQSAVAPEAGAAEPSEPAAEGAEPAEPPPEIGDGRLLELAGLRTTRVIGHLAAQPEISRERLFACRESVDAGADAVPRVEITL